MSCDLYSDGYARGMRRIVALSIGSLLLLAGCATPQPNTEVSPVPDTSEATTEQVASVLAAYEPDWREVIDKAGECRAIWSFGSTPADDLQGMSCYLREQTIGNTAQLVIRDWGELEVPSSMTDIVADTEAILQQVAEVDLTTICGADEAPAEEKTCNEALGSRNFLYSLLETQLDAWSPYL